MVRIAVMMAISWSISAEVPAGASARASGKGDTMIDAAPPSRGRRCQISSVTKGIMGWSRRSAVSRVSSSTSRVTGACAGSAR